MFFKIYDSKKKNEVKCFKEQKKGVEGFGAAKVRRVRGHSWSQETKRKFTSNNLHFDNFYSNKNGQQTKWTF